MVFLQLSMLLLSMIISSPLEHCSYSHKQKGIVIVLNSFDRQYFVGIGTTRHYEAHEIKRYRNRIFAFFGL